MAENLTVARPYAQATFEIALEENNLSGWQTMLEAMAVACKDQYFPYLRAYSVTDRRLPFSQYTEYQIHLRYK